MDECPAEAAPHPEARIEAVRRAIVGVRSRLRALEEQARAGTLPPAGHDRRRRLQAEEQELAATLRGRLRPRSGAAAPPAAPAPPATAAGAGPGREGRA